MIFSLVIKKAYICRQMSDKTMGLISTKKPFSLLFIIIIEVGLGFLLSMGGLAIDLAIYDPPADHPSFPIPLFMGIFMFLSAAIIFLSLIVIIIMIIFLRLKKRA